MGSERLAFSPEFVSVFNYGTLLSMKTELKKTIWLWFDSRTTRGVCDSVTAPGSRRKRGALDGTSGRRGFLPASTGAGDRTPSSSCVGRQKLSLRSDPFCHPTQSSQIVSAQRTPRESSGHRTGHSRPQAWPCCSHVNLLNSGCTSGFPLVARIQTPSSCLRP